MELSISILACIGCGLCEDINSQIFKVNENGLAVVKRQPEPSDMMSVNRAINQCPVMAISFMQITPMIKPTNNLQIMNV